MLTKDGEDLQYYCVVFLLGPAEDEDVIHVDNYSLFIYGFLVDVVHHHLKCSWTICEAEEYDQGFKQAFRLCERSLSIHLPL